MLVNRLLTLIILSSCTIAGCYTTIPRSEGEKGSANSVSSPKGERSNQYSVAEGVVGYRGEGNVRETHYSSGFILESREWIVNPPPERRDVVYLVGAIDSSYLNRAVRVKGLITLDQLYNSPDRTSQMWMNVDSIEIIE